MQQQQIDFGQMQPGQALLGRTVRDRSARNAWSRPWWSRTIRRASLPTRAGPRRPRVRSHRPERCRYGGSRADRLFDQACAGSSAQFPGTEPDRRDFGAVGLDELHGRVLERPDPHYVPPGARCQHGRGADALRSAKDGRPSAANTVSGAWAITARSARAGPRGRRLPCSQLRMVSTGTPSRAANSSCVRRARRRRSRTAGAGAGQRQRRRERKLPPVTQFDDPPVRFQPQPPHVPPHAARHSRRCALRFDYLFLFLHEFPVLR